MNQTLDQARARYAFTRVSPADEQFVLKLPQMIRAYGLGQTLAFLLAEEKNKAQADLVYQALEGWLCGDPDHDHPMRVYANSGDLIHQLGNGSRTQYQFAQEEALVLAGWMKRMVETADAGMGGGSDAPAVP